MNMHTSHFEELATTLQHISLKSQDLSETIAAATADAISIKCNSSESKELSLEWQHI